MKNKSDFFIKNYNYFIHYNDLLDACQVLLFEFVRSCFLLNI